MICFMLYLKSNKYAKKNRLFDYISARRQRYNVRFLYSHFLIKKCMLLPRV